MSKLSKFIKLYHHNSTRYIDCNREFLQKFEGLWKKKQPHYKPVSFVDKSLHKFIKVLRVSSDLYFKDDLVRRAVMLETIAAVPGIIEGTYHHMRSLRTMKQSHWVKVTMDEAENERMHLMALMDLYQPTFFQRFLLSAAQVGFFWFFLIFYTVSKGTAHRFVGYLEEEAVTTYTKFLDMIDNGKIPNEKAPSVAIEYWGLPEDASLRDLIIVIRADEADHRLVNHAMSDIYKKKECNFSFHMDIHHPWQGDGIRQIEESGEEKLVDQQIERELEKVVLKKQNRKKKDAKCGEVFAHNPAH